MGYTDVFFGAVLVVLAIAFAYFLGRVSAHADRVKRQADELDRLIKRRKGTLGNSG